VLPATGFHAAYVASRMREAEQVEVWAGSHFSPDSAVEDSVRHSPQAFAAVVNGATMGIFGVRPVSHLLGVGIPWLLTTGEVDRHPRAFLRLCRQILPGFRARWPLLMNFIHARHVRSVAWAERLGFTVFDPAPLGVDGEDFRKIELRT